jgi:uncharacterized protein YigE (DUF2233 family)
MAATRSNFVAAALAFALGGCEAEPEPAAPAREHVVAAHCEQRRFEGSRFTACRYDSRRHRLELILDPAGRPLRSLAALEAHLGRRAGALLFAMNAGMYDEDGMPIGLYVEAGRQRRAINLRDGPGNFHLKPNGVFAVDRAGRPSIVRSEQWRRRRPSETGWATQSGPLLVIAGALHPRISANGESLNIRNGVGVSDRHTAWFAISEEPVSFGRFARFFRDALGCRDALFLDGTVSSLWHRRAGRQDAGYEIGPIAAVFARPPAPPPKRP